MFVGHKEGALPTMGAVKPSPHGSWNRTLTEPVSNHLLEANNLLERCRDSTFIPGESLKLDVLHKLGM